MHTHKTIATAYDVIIAGGGAAGLSAALTLGRARRRVLLIDSSSPRNRFASHMHGVLGHDGLPPLTLVEKGREELARYGVTIVHGTITSVTDVIRGLRITHTSGDSSHGTAESPETVDYARTLLLATGINDELPDIPGLAAHWGGAVFQCPYCHGWEVRDQRIGVIATSTMAVHHATLIRQWTDQLTIFFQDAAILEALDATTRARFDARDIQVVSSPIVEVLSAEGTELNREYESTGTTGSSSGRLTGVRTQDGRIHEMDALAVSPVPHPRDDFLDHLGLDRTELPGMGSFLRSDAMGKTSHPRIWAVGNVADPRLTVSAAAGQATMTAGAVNFTLVEEDTDSALNSKASHSGWPEVSVDEFWEQTYSTTPARWSGRPNTGLVGILTEVFGEAAPAGSRGRAADIGSGEGADVIWLADQGWNTTGVEVSATAARRARDAAEAAGVAEQTQFTDTGLLGFRDQEQENRSSGSGKDHNPADSTGSGTLDLVTASYLHSPSQDRRESLLHTAGELVASGGHFFVLSHILPPHSEDAGHPDHTGHNKHVGDSEHSVHSGAAASLSAHTESPTNPTAEHAKTTESAEHTETTEASELTDLGLDPHTWHIVRAENVYRTVVFPDGTVAESPDRALLLQRR